MQPNYLNTLYLYFPLNTFNLYTQINDFFLYFIKCRLVFKLPVGEISIPHKLGFSEISPPQSLLPSKPKFSRAAQKL